MREETMLECGCHRQVTRRNVLKAGAAALATSGIAARVFAQSGTPAIDIHAHYWPRTMLDLFAAEGKRFGADFSATSDGFSIKAPGVNQSGLPLKFIDLRQRIADMDQQGVAMQAISLTAPMVYWGDAELNHNLARSWNDAASAAHQEFPNRLVVLATLPMLDRDRAVDELDRVAKLPGVRGVYLGTNINGKDLDDPMFLPIYERIDALKLPIFLHPLNTIGGDRMRPYYLANLLGNPYDTGIAASHLIFGGILDKFPNLQVSLPHSGGTLPILIGRLDQGWKVRSETRHLAQAPSRYLKRFTYDTISHNDAIMKFIISQIGADHVVLGSDYCYDMGYERPVQFVDSLGLAAAERDLILGGTAARILKL
jgi:aminocarboxymuconate-semialdehyde decarboxylase